MLKMVNNTSLRHHSAVSAFWGFLFREGGERVLSPSLTHTLSVCVCVCVHLNQLCVCAGGARMSALTHLSPCMHVWLFLRNTGHYFQC